MFEITLWLYDLQYSLNPREYGNRDFFEDRGIELLFDLHGATASGFMFQLGAFSHHFEIEGHHELYHGYNLESSYFLKFMDYMILLMKSLLDEKLDDYEPEFTADQISEVETITQKYGSEQVLFEIISSEIESFKGYWAAHDENSSYRISPEVQTIYMAEAFFLDCLKAKRTISDVNTHILLLDS